MLVVKFCTPRSVRSVLGEPEPPIFVVPVYDTLLIVFEFASPVSAIVPEADKRFVHDVFWLFDEPPDLLQLKRNIPPALKKYLNWVALANVKVFVNVALEDHVEVVLELTDESDPFATALNLLSPVTAVILDDKAAYAEIVSPAVGFVIAVIDVPWCDAILLIGVNKLLHCVAVIVEPALTALIAV